MTAASSGSSRASSLLQRLRSSTNKQNAFAELPLMSTPKISLYNLALRWHFYAGLFVAPFMVLLALTGIIYLFKPQLDPLMYADLLTVQSAEHALSADEQLQRAQAAFPQGKISKYLPPADATRDRKSTRL